MAKGVTIDLIVDPKGAIDGLSQVEDKSSSVAGVLGKLGGVAAAGVVALGTAALAAVGGLTAATLSAGAYAEEVALAASTTHLTTDAVQELQYAAKITGVDFETITGSMTKLTKSMGAAQDGTGAQAEAFARLGVATTDANGNLLDSTVVYSNVIEALGQVENPAERDVIAMQLLGKSATDLNPLIDGTAGSIEELAAQAHAAGAVLSGETLTKLASVDDAFDALSAGADAAKNALGLSLLPVLQQLGDEGTGLLGRFTNAVLEADGDLSKAAPAIGAVFGDAVTFLLGQVPQFLEVGTSIISALLQGVISRAPALITQAIPILVGFVSSLISQLPALLDAGLKILTAVIQGLATAIPQLIPVALQAILGLVNALIANVPLLLNAALSLVTGLAQGIIAALPTLIAALPGIILGIVDFLVSAIPTIIDTGITLLLSLVDALPAIIDGIVTAIPAIITGLVSALVTAQPALMDAGIRLFVALIEALPTIIISLNAAVPQIIDGLIKAFTSPQFIGQMADAGQAIIQGLIDGIGSMLGAVGNAVGGVMDYVASFFPHSPAERGPFSGSGWTQLHQSGLALANQFNSGVEDGFADGIMTDLSGQVAAGFDASFAATARATVLTSAEDASFGTGGDGITADPTQHTLLRQIASKLDNIEPGWILPETLAAVSQTGNRRLSALGAG